MGPANVRIYLALAILSVALAGFDAAAAAATQSTNDRSDTESSAEQRQSSELETIVVTGDRPYRFQDTMNASRIAAPPMDLPGAMQVIPRTVIDDQGGVRLADALQNVSGITPGDTSGNRVEKFIVRGFENDRQVAIDGYLPPPAFGNVGYLDLATVDRVEVLKGPASILYGQGSLGGFINIVTKRPSEARHFELKGSVGSYDHQRLEGDLNLPLDSNGRALFRLNAAHQDVGSFRDRFRDSTRTILAPSLKLRPKARTVVDLQLEYVGQQAPVDFGLVPLGGRADALTRSFYREEAFSLVESEVLRGRSAVEFAFEGGWVLQLSATVTDSESNRLSADVTGVRDDGRTLNRRTREFLQDVKGISSQNNLTGSVETGAVRHDLLFGFDLARSEYDASDRRATLAPLDAFEPVYGAMPGPLGNARLTARDVDFYAVHFHDLMSIGEHWKVLLGGRFDRADQRESSGGVISNDVTDSTFTPRFGVVYQPTENLSLYASYAESFLPPAFLFTSSRPATGSEFEPETGVQYELGIKAVLLEKRISMTLAVFELTRQNVITPDPVDIDVAVQTGEQRSQGMEWDVVGSIFPGFDLIGTLTYLDAEVTRDTLFPEGNRLANSSKWAGSLWASYAFEGDTLAGLELGAGAFAQSGRQADLDNSIKAPGFVRLDAFASYRINDHVKVALNAKNILGKNYIRAALARSIDPGEPFTLLGSVEVRF